ncbi:MAG: hypothetical protein WDN25_13470 [Acetobacteraceae bacterium]
MAKILFANNARTTLAGAISTVSVTATLAAGSGALFPHPGANEYFVGSFFDALTGVVTEIVHVTNVTGDTITMVRAQEGTSAQNWSAGDLFANRWTAGSANTMIQIGALRASVIPQYFTNSGTWIVPAGVTEADVQLWGGGGGGQGCDTNGAAGGGSGGGYSRKRITGLVAGQSISVSIGAGGAGGAAGPNVGSAGGTTTFGAVFSATGGGGGNNVNPTPGTGAGGDLNLFGGGGGGAVIAGGGPAYYGGPGGDGAFGGGGGPASGGVGSGGAIPGGGGGGGGSTVSANAGGDGGKGMAIVSYVALTGA